ncbi:hypothetical protein CN692_14735 [Bacillus sp. AFS002410]|uniref:DUF4309 domain-containing protein n=1 Tax=Bacillus sp. AFS002410 TaxID=2033481 RepID=UPI000BF20088|nr:DUF4309 domain-containing protein [Bacillus sp. AFS002410]PEJ56846.1 hypothetical protein CN692_14735 [Bacillus sp. AFS002410]
MNYIKSNKLFIGLLIAAVVALGFFAPTIYNYTKHSLKVHKIESEKKAFLIEIEKQAKEGKMINSPFKLGESSALIRKNWGKSDMFKEEDMNKEPTKMHPFFMDLFSDGLIPMKYRSRIYSKHDTKFEITHENKIKSITSVDKRLDKLKRNELTKYFGKPSIEGKDYVVYRVGDYQLLFNFWHDEEFFNTTRYTILRKDSKKQIAEIKEIAQLAKKGKVPDVPISIGETKNGVYKIMGEPEDTNIPGLTLRYKKASIEVDEKTKKVIDISPNAQFYQASFVTVKNTLGEPYKEEQKQKVTSPVISYRFGKYELTFFFFTESSSNPELSGIMLSEIESQ